ncbi:MAG: gliding motility-associated C-terminal domain-containing protein, partial [Candidatus Bipolaricaulota bacterium]|nr:gliding motility-associated C-terminal domain-containing protein [Candidatus Bipolaricaulota bacterium]
QVQVYNLTGKLVFSAETAGKSLSWNGLSSDGRQLANGVYLYVMTVKGTYGDLVQTRVQKLAILR